jgi:hypothetical protein
VYFYFPTKALRVASTGRDPALNVPRSENGEVKLAIKEKSLRTRELKESW